MKKILDLITFAASFIFMLGVGALDADPLAGVSMMFLSGIVLAARCESYKHKQRLHGRR